MDFRDYGDGKPAKDSSRTNSEMKWWTLSAKEAADSISATLKSLKDQQSKRVAQLMVNARLYGNMSLIGPAGVSFSKISAVQPGIRDRITYNVIQSCVDTAQSKMAKNKPKPLFLTSGGDYKTQRKAKKLNQFIDGVFYEHQAYDMGIQSFLDAEVLADGLIHVFPKDGRLAWERVLPWELMIDEVEGFYGKPRQMHYVKQMDRSQLLAMIPGHKGDISNADSANQNDRGGHLNIADMVEVRESWHLPSSPKAKDGKHIITIDGHNLTLMEPYAHDFFPFARLPWCPRLWGYWSQSGAEQIQSIQLEINKLLWVIQRSFHLMGSFKVFIANGSKIVKEHLNNDIGAIVNYEGSAPQYVSPPIVQPEIFQHLNTLKASAYEQFGISMMNATSTKPAGLNSGKALREYDDIGTDRFLTPGQRYQKFYLDLAKLSIACIKDIAAENKGHYEVRVPGKKFLKTIDWKDIDLEEEEYVMQCFPVSSLPSDPEGRLQTVQEYAQAGYLTPRQAKRLLDFPDLEQVESLANAEEDYITEILEKIVDEGEYTPPEPFDDLDLAKELCMEFYAQGKCQQLEEEKLDMLRQFMGQIDQLKQIAMQAMAPQAPGMGPPQANAAPPPVSDLIPNAPQAPQAPTIQ